jgi:uncharacterized protein YjbI with pentapeptide repeats
MIAFDVKNRFTGNVQFTAEIDCSESGAHSLKMGLAAKWALNNGANLNGANLEGAKLGRAKLNGAILNGINLEWANLEGVNLYGAKLEGANLYGADLNGANLYGAKLEGADLNGANLYGAKLEGADLNGANLEGANLYGADLNGANLNGANLEGANLEGANGVNEYIKCVQIEAYPITYTADILQIGCQRHSIEDWRTFDSRRIAAMDGKGALKFWAKYKNWIFQTIELCPAKPTGVGQ